MDVSLYLVVFAITFTLYGRESCISEGWQAALAGFGFRRVAPAVFTVPSTAMFLGNARARGQATFIYCWASFKVARSRGERRIYLSFYYFRSNATMD